MMSVRIVLAVSMVAFYSVLTVQEPAVRDRMLARSLEVHWPS